MLLFFALCETINTVAAGTDFVVLVENITALRSGSGGGSDLRFLHSTNHTSKMSDRSYLKPLSPDELSSPRQRRSLMHKHGLLALNGLHDGCHGRRSVRGLQSEALQTISHTEQRQRERELFASGPRRWRRSKMVPSNCCAAANLKLIHKRCFVCCI